VVTEYKREINSIYELPVKELLVFLMNSISMKQQNNIHILLNSQQIRKSNKQYWYSWARSATNGVDLEKRN
jgi:hypothetical protein